MTNPCKILRRQLTKKEMYFPFYAGALHRPWFHGFIFINDRTGRPHDQFQEYDMYRSENIRKDHPNQPGTVTIRMIEYEWKRYIDGPFEVIIYLSFPALRHQSYGERSSSVNMSEAAFLATLTAPLPMAVPMCGLQSRAVIHSVTCHGHYFRTGASMTRNLASGVSSHKYALCHLLFQCFGRQM